MDRETVIKEFKELLEESLIRKYNPKSQAFYLLGTISAYYELGIISTSDYKKLYEEIKEKLGFTTEDFDSIAQ
jgi:hypothetical protein